MEESTALSPSMEDYLESMYMIQKNGTPIRIKDIAEILSVKMPSVIGALKILKERGYIEYEKTTPLTLTEKGIQTASSVLKRHNILSDFLEKTLLLPHDEADATACRLEHAITTETARRLENLVSYTESLKEQASLKRREWELIITGKRT